MGETVFQSNFTYRNRGWTPRAVVFSPVLQNVYQLQVNTLSQGCMEKSIILGF